jgi:hypothetical protein
MIDQTETTETAAMPQAPAPHPRLRDLEVLEGTWRLESRDPASGETSTATIIREWLPGGYFMTQRTETEGQPQVGMEYIGYDAATDSLRSMLFSGGGPGPFCSFALEYFWDITGDQLTIWHGFKDSPAKFTGSIDRDARVVHGRWEWPGGGYEATTTRLS